MKKIVLILIALSLIPISGFAFTLDQYNANGASSAVNAVYLAGLGEGYSWANAMLSNQKRAPLYCQPSKLSLNGKNYAEILIKTLSARSFSSTDDVGFILLLGLIDTFPCKD